MKQIVESLLITEILDKKETFGCCDSSRIPLTATQGGSAAFVAGLDGIQYAHARICIIFKQIDTRMPWSKTLGLSHLYLLDKPPEIRLQTALCHYPNAVATAASALKPHPLVHSLRKLAQALHAFFNAVPLLCEEERLRSARLCFIEATRQVLNNGLTVLGVSALESM